MPATKRGIYHNLKESKYTVSNTEIVFFFSSRLYLVKFLDGYKEHRESYLNRLGKTHIDIPLNMGLLADITFYRMIEKRGFRAKIKGVDFNCEDLHLYALRKMTVRNTLDWLEIQSPKLGERRITME